MSKKNSTRTSTTNIAQRAACGCQTSFGRLIRRLQLGRQLARLMPQTFRSRFDVEDVLQDSHLSIWRSIQANPPSYGTRRLAAAIARRKMTDYIRYHRAARRSVSGDVGGELDVSILPAQGAPAPDELLAVREELDRLPADIRDALRLRSEGSSWPDIASQLGVPVSRLTSRVSRYFKTLPKVPGEPR